MGIKDNLDKLNQPDIYSLLLFALYKITEIPEYSTLSELIYTLDKDNFLKLCEHFGGLTIKIPTLDELQILIYALMLYKLVDIDKVSYKESIKEINCSSEHLKKVKKMYLNLQMILLNYSFKENKNEI